MQANPKFRRRSNLGKRRQSAWPEFKPEPSTSGLSFAPRSALARHHLSAKKTPASVFNKAAYATQFFDKSNETKKRLFEFRSPHEKTMNDSTTPIQDVTGICCLNPSPEPSANIQSTLYKTLNSTPFDSLKPPESPVLKYSYQPYVTDLKPPVDPEDRDDWIDPFNRSLLTLKDCTSGLNILEISDVGTKKVSPTENKCVSQKEVFEDRSPASNCKHNDIQETFRFSGKIGHPLVNTLRSEPGQPLVNIVNSEPGKTESTLLALKQSSIYNQDSQDNNLQVDGSNHKGLNEKHCGIKPLVEPKEVSQESDYVNDSSFNEFKKPESILQVLRSSGKKLSVVKEDDSESLENSLDDSFLLAEETISDMTIVSDSNPANTKLKSEENILQVSTDFFSANLSDTMVNDKEVDVKMQSKIDNDLGDSDDDLNDLLNRIDCMSEGCKEQQVLYEKELTRVTSLLQESRKREIIREKELAQLKLCVHRLKKKNKTNQPSVENKENKVVKSTQKLNEWIKMKKDNPNLLKTPNVRRTNRMSVANQSTTWTPHSLSKMVSNQMDNLYD